MPRSINPVPQYFDNSGDLVPGGKLTFWESGTSTLKDTFVDAGLTTANTNPLILDGAGRMPSCFFDGVARERFTDANNVVIWERDPVGSDTSTGAFSDYSTTTVYGINDLVTFSNRFWQSKIDNNQNNQPDVSLTQWEEVRFNRVYNSTTEYGLNDVVVDAGFNYRSLVASNTGNTPASSPDEWAQMGGAPVIQIFTSTGTYTPTAGVQAALVECIAAGGGGGGVGVSSASEFASGSGGGGGATAESLITSPVSTAITIGAAGAGGIGAADGSAGGDTSFGSLVVADGGQNGFSVDGATTERVTVGGFGGTASISVGDITAEGQPGNNAISNSTLTVLGGQGGSSSFSGGGPPTAFVGNGGTPGGFGGGGGGALSKNSAAANGGAGAPGLVVITEYI